MIDEVQVQCYVDSVQRSVRTLDYLRWLNQIEARDLLRWHWSHVRGVNFSSYGSE